MMENEDRIILLTDSFYFDGLKTDIKFNDLLNNFAAFIEICLEKKLNISYEDNLFCKEICYSTKFDEIVYNHISIDKRYVSTFFCRKNVTTKININTELKKVKTLVSKDNFNTFFVFNNSSYKEIYHITNFQEHLSCINYYLQNIKLTCEDFFDKINFYYENILIRNTNNSFENFIKDITLSYSFDYYRPVIAKCLYLLNTNLIELILNNPLESEVNIINRFSSNSGYETTLQGKILYKEKHYITYDFFIDNKNQEIYCEPHMKLSGLNQNERESDRIYFNMDRRLHNSNEKIYIGKIGKHPPFTTKT